jgi:hypothetical protein
MVNVLRRKGTCAGGSQSRGNADVSSHFVCDQLRESSIGQGRWSDEAQDGQAAYLYDELLGPNLQTLARLHFACGIDVALGPVPGWEGASRWLRSR